MEKFNRKSVLDVLSKYNGMLTPEVYTKAGFPLADLAGSPHKLVDRIRTIVEGAEAEDEIPPFEVVPHRERKSHGVDFQQVVMPRDPDQRLRATTDPMKEATNYWPAIVLMTPELQKVRESRLKLSLLARDVLERVRGWAKNNLPTGTEIIGASPGADIKDASGKVTDSYTVFQVRMPTSVIDG